MTAPGTTLLLGVVGSHAYGMAREGYAVTGPSCPAASVLVSRWVREDGFRSRLWYWETRFGGAVVAAGTDPDQERARQRGIDEVALAAYIAGLCGADHD